MQQHEQDTLDVQYASVFGPAARFSEYKRGDTVRYRFLGEECQGLIEWVAAPHHGQPLTYVICGRGFPDPVSQSEILGLL